MTMRQQHLWRVSAGSLFLMALTATLLSGASATDTGLPTLTATTDDAVPTAAASTTGSSASSGDSAAATTTANPDALPSLSTSAAASSDALPSLSTTAAASISHANDLPTLAGAYSYPPPSVPPTANAPYMQKSNLPEGTVFICVGAGLAFIALVMFTWRLMVAWSINRSVKKAAFSPYPQDMKTTHQPRKKSGFYSQSPGSDLSLEKLSSTGKSTFSNSKSQPPNSSLFFSPTAGAGMHTMGNRNSGYLPAGYYSSGNAAPGNGMPMTQVGGKSRPPSSSLSQQVPSGHYDVSPDASPSLPPTRSYNPTQESSSSVNISTVTGSRAPSHFLDDLMSIPPLPPPGGSSRTSSDRYRR